jgi:hypothetical protein
VFKFSLLRRTDISTLCSRHLHGSWWRRMVHEYRRPIECVDCRAGLNPQIPQGKR